MNAPEGFLEIVGDNLLGQVNQNGKSSNVKIAPQLDDVIVFMAHLFIRSTSHAETVILALDDVQWMDDLSWKVLQYVLGNSNHILIVCGSRLLESFTVSLDDDFWAILNGEYKEKEIFSEVVIEVLDERSVREMASIVLSCQPADVDDNFCDDIYKHSGGMPYFASEILENCVRHKQYALRDNGKIGWSASSEKVCILPSW